MVDNGMILICADNSYAKRPICAIPFPLKNILFPISKGPILPNVQCPILSNPLSNDNVTAMQPRVREQMSFYLKEASMQDPAHAPL